MTRAFFILLVLLLSFKINFSQQAPSLNEQLLKVSFDGTKTPETKARRFLSFKKKASWFNPLNYVAASVLFVYQNIFSEQIMAECMYETSCSQYTKLTIQQDGLLPGLLKGINQLQECYHSAIYEHPPLFVTEDKIKNSLDKTSE